jgi:dCMP deaminase
MRKDWDRYFMDIAFQAATRATCDRKHVGAVIVSPDRNILATGYNGSIPGTPHCDDAGHMMIFDPNTNRESCVRTVHAEANAIVQAAKHGSRIQGGTIYTTASPCWPCFKLIASAGLRRIVFGELYRDERIYEFAKTAKIELQHLPKPESPTA